MSRNKTYMHRENDFFEYFFWRYLIHANSIMLYEIISLIG